MLAKLDREFDKAGLTSTQGLMPAYGDPRCWHVLVTRRNEEKRAADHMRSLNLLVYFPNFSRLQKQSHGRRAPGLCPIFAGIIFIPSHKETGDPWKIVNRVPYILNFFRDENGGPAGLTDKEIERIREIEADANAPEKIKIIHQFKVGDKVRFVDDIYLGLKGPIKEVASDGRIRVEVDLLGRKVLIWTTAPQIEKM